MVPLKVSNSVRNDTSCSQLLSQKIKIRRTTTLMSMMKSGKNATGSEIQIWLVEPESKNKSLKLKDFCKHVSDPLRNSPKTFSKASADLIHPTIYSPHNAEGNRPLNAHIFEFSLVRVINGLQQATERKEDKTYLQTVG